MKIIIIKELECHPCYNVLPTIIIYSIGLRITCMSLFRSWSEIGRAEIKTNMQAKHMNDTDEYNAINLS